MKTIYFVFPTTYPIRKSQAFSVKICCLQGVYCLDLNEIPIWIRLCLCLSGLLTELKKFTLEAENGSKKAADDKLSRRKVSFMWKS